MIKNFAEIDGKLWEVSTFVFCAGCPEGAIGDRCLYEGNGCRFPELRTRRPISFRNAFCIIAKRGGKCANVLADELGPCSRDEILSEDEENHDPR